MSNVRQTKQGLLIPSRLLKGIGEAVAVRRQGDVLIIESEQREAARKRLSRMVRILRRASGGNGRLTAAAIAAEVEAVRRRRACHR